jgi:hypothetical protein
MGGMRDRKQIPLLPEYVDDYIGQDSPVSGCRCSLRPRRKTRWDGDQLFEVPGQQVRFEAATEVKDRLDLIRGAVSRGDVETLISHPAGVAEAKRVRLSDVRTGLHIPARLSRLSVGWEDSKDLIDDLRQALDAVPSHS